MSAYDRPIATNVERTLPQGHNEVGAVIKFKSTDVDRIQQWLDRAALAGIILPTAARSYDSTYGGPVWDIP